MNASRGSGSDKMAPLATADSVLAAQGRSFHWARHLLGRVHADRATRLYRLCRYIDDLADECHSTALAKQALAAAAASIRDGNSDDPIIQDGLALLHECRIESVVFLDLISGVQSDLELVRMPDLDSLLRYCYQVAGTVGLMMCKVLDTETRAAFAHAIDLGIAMQLTNICRDIAADAAADRRYLPASMVGDVSPELLLCPSGELSVHLKACVSSLLDYAEKYYQSGERGLSYLPVRARGSILVAARVYREIGLQLRARDHVYWSGRVVVSPLRKAAVTSRALIAHIFGPSFWHIPARHDTRLHSALLNFPASSYASVIADCDGPPFKASSDDQ
jgi:phytoene synthase